MTVLSTTIDLYGHFTHTSFRLSKNTSVCVSPLIDGRYHATLFDCSQSKMDAWYSRYNPRRRGLLLDTSGVADLLVPDMPALFQKSMQLVTEDTDGM